MILKQKSYLTVMKKKPNSQERKQPDRNSSSKKMESDAGKQ